MTKQTASSRGSPSDADTAQRVLDVAEHLVQVRGFNAFSYADVAGELGITKAALHYHYPGKAELGEALVRRYTRRFEDALEEIDASQKPAPVKLKAYVSLYARVLGDDRMCLCGMLAAEYQTLPEALREAIVTFFDANEAWLAALLAQGRRDGSLTFDGSTTDTARAIVSGLEGAMLVARPYGDPGRFKKGANAMLATLTAAR